MNQFGSLVGKLEQEIPGATSSSTVGGYFTFSFEGVKLMNTLVLPTVLVLTVVNAMTPKLVDGGHNFKIFYYLALTMGMSGALLIAVPYATTALFGVVG